MLADEFRKQFIWLGENIENHITFTVPIKKVNTIIDKLGERITKNISYILQVIDRIRFLASSLSNLVSNLSKWIHKIKCKYGHDSINYETCRINISIATIFFSIYLLNMI